MSNHHNSHPAPAQMGERPPTPPPVSGSLYALNVGLSGAGLLQTSVPSLSASPLSFIQPRPGSPLHHSPGPLLIQAQPVGHFAEADEDVTIPDAFPVAQQAGPGQAAFVPEDEDVDGVPIIPSAPQSASLGAAFGATAPDSDTGNMECVDIYGRALNPHPPLDQEATTSAVGPTRTTRSSSKRKPIKPSDVAVAAKAAKAAKVGSKTAPPAGKSGGPKPPSKVGSKVGSSSRPARQVESASKTKIPVAGTIAAGSQPAPVHEPHPDHGAAAGAAAAPAVNVAVVPATNTVPRPAVNVGVPVVPAPVPVPRGEGPNAAPGPAPVAPLPVVFGHPGAGSPEFSLPGFGATPEVIQASIRAFGGRALKAAMDRHDKPKGDSKGDGVPSLPRPAEPGEKGEVLFKVQDGQVCISVEQLADDAVEQVIRHVELLEERLFVHALAPGEEGSGPTFGPLDQATTLERDAQHEQRLQEQMDRQRHLAAEKKVYYPEGNKFDLLRHLPVLQTYTGPVACKTATWREDQADERAAVPPGEIIQGDVELGRGWKRTQMIEPDTQQKETMMMIDASDLERNDEQCYLGSLPLPPGEMPFDASEAEWFDRLCEPMQDVRAAKAKRARRKEEDQRTLEAAVKTRDAARAKRKEAIALRKKLETVEDDAKELYEQVKDDVKFFKSQWHRFKAAAVRAQQTASASIPVQRDTTMPDSTAPATQPVQGDTTMAESTGACAEPLQGEAVMQDGSAPTPAAAAAAESGTTSPQEPEAAPAAEGQPCEAPQAPEEPDASPASAPEEEAAMRKKLVARNDLIWYVERAVGKAGAKAEKEMKKRAKGAATASEANGPGAPSTGATPKAPTMTRKAKRSKKVPLHPAARKAASSASGPAVNPEVVPPVDPAASTSAAPTTAPARDQPLASGANPSIAPVRPCAASSGDPASSGADASGAPTSSSATAAETPVRPSVPVGPSQVAPDPATTGQSAPAGGCTDSPGSGASAANEAFAATPSAPNADGSDDPNPPQPSTEAPKQFNHVYKLRSAGARSLIYAGLASAMRNEWHIKGPVPAPKMTEAQPDPSASQSHGQDGVPENGSAEGVQEVPADGHVPGEASTSAQPPDNADCRSKEAPSSVAQVSGTSKSQSATAAPAVPAAADDEGAAAPDGSQKAEHAAAEESAATPKKVKRACLTEAEFKRFKLYERLVASGHNPMGRPSGPSGPVTRENPNPSKGERLALPLQAEGHAQLSQFTSALFLPNMVHARTDPEEMMSVMEPADMPKIGYHLGQCMFEAGNVIENASRMASRAVEKADKGKKRTLEDDEGNALAPCKRTRLSDISDFVGKVKSRAATEMEHLLAEFGPQISVMLKSIRILEDKIHSGAIHDRSTDGSAALWESLLFQLNACVSMEKKCTSLEPLLARLAVSVDDRVQALLESDVAMPDAADEAGQAGQRSSTEFRRASRPRAPWPERLSRARRAEVEEATRKLGMPWHTAAFCVRAMAQNLRTCMDSIHRQMTRAIVGEHDVFHIGIWAKIWMTTWEETHAQLVEQVAGIHLCLANGDSSFI